MQEEPVKSSPSAIDIVWQWVCYGLWIWTLAMLSVLLAATLSYFFVVKGSDYEFVVYILAATLCLLPLSVVVDRVYAKREPQQKHGFASVVMVLNGVVVFLATVAALITAAVSVLSMAIDPPSDARTITIISALVVTILGTMLFVRIINPVQLRRFTHYFAWIALAIAAVTITLSFAGPFARLMQTRDDRLIESGLPDLDSEISSYADQNSALPSSLYDLSLDSEYQNDAKTLVQRGLVEYKEDATPSKSLSEIINGALNNTNISSQTYYYELCVHYAHIKGSGSADGSAKTDLYTAVNNHPSGKVCYSRDTSLY